MFPYKSGNLLWIFSVSKITPLATIALGPGAWRPTPNPHLGHTGMGRSAPVAVGARHCPLPGNCSVDGFLDLIQPLQHIDHIGIWKGVKNSVEDVRYTSGITRGRFSHFNTLLAACLETTASVPPHPVLVDRFGQALLACCMEVVAQEGDKKNPWNMGGPKSQTLATRIMNQKPLRTARAKKKDGLVSLVVFPLPPFLDTPRL